MPEACVSASSLAELLIRQKRLGVARLKEHQTHFVQLMIRAEKILNRPGSDFSRFVSRIAEHAG